MSDLLLENLLVYGSPAFAIVLFIGSLGVPLPITMLMIAAGAFVQQGVLSGPLLTALALPALIGGDSSSYLIGRSAGALLHRKIEKNRPWRMASAIFRCWGARTIFLTRFLLTPLALPTNLIAGSTGYGFGRFLLFDVTGQLLWFVLYGSLGYIFAGSWEAMNDLAGSLGGLALGIAAAALGGFIGYHTWQRHTAPAGVEQPSFWQRYIDRVPCMREE